MGAANFKTATNFGVKALKNMVAEPAGVTSAKAVSQVAASEAGSKRPLTVVPGIEAAVNERKSIIAEAVAKRNSEIAVSQIPSQRLQSGSGLPPRAQTAKGSCPRSVASEA
jgi:hypothetical protein